MFMEKEDMLRQLKNKKIGALLIDARLASSRNVDECARILSLPREEYLSFEKGHKSPSIPQLEALSVYLDVSLDHFNGKSSKYEAMQSGYRKNLEKIMLVRDRIIGANIRKARIEHGFSLDAFSEKVGFSPTLLKNYELGKIPIPLTDLELVAAALGQNIESYYEKYDEQKSEKSLQIRMEQFLNLPETLQDFVTKPINKPFLELANKLADLPVDRLRSVAEGLLEITY
jgi:transcriptional regulator with XRE-family HTH domain